jgi:hypothetical protein
MSTAIMDGYTGIYRGNEQFVYDVLFILVFVLLSFFSIFFRSFNLIFTDMLSKLFSLKERQSIFDEPVKDSVFFMGFMRFQMLLLSTVFGYLIYCNRAGFPHGTVASLSAALILFFVFACAFYMFKQAFYLLNGFVFGDNSDSRLWRVTYHKLSALWGISLYLPVAGLMFFPNYLLAVVFVFFTLYVAYRFTLIYMTVRIFYNEKNGLLYLSSYLCAQEIIPLLLLYEGLNYLYNTIESGTLWH